MIKKMKKCLLVIIALLSMSALIACSDDEDDSNDDKEGKYVAAKDEEDVVKKFAKAFEDKNMDLASKYYIIDLKDLLDEEFYKLYSDGKTEMMLSKGCYVTLKANVTLEIGDKKEYSKEDLKASFAGEDAKELEYIDDVDEDTIFGFDTVMKLETKVLDTRVDIEETGLGKDQLKELEKEYGMPFDEYFRQYVEEDLSLDEVQENEQVIFVGKYDSEWRVLNIATPD
ncbi:MAG: hypothetical protein J6L69_08005 [Lachnospiraceae bacterium]|nr:hypothetical protein [Lachnospiraceae bacterium]